MASTGSNIIQRQIVELTVNGQVDGIDLQRQADGLVKNDLMPKLDQLMNKYGQKQWIRIDRLAVEIPDLQWSDFAGSFSDRILIEVEKELSRIVETKPIGPMLIDGFERSEAADREHFIRLMIFTLQHGYLPWWSTIKTMSQWQDAFDGIFVSSAILAQNEISELKKILNNQFSLNRLVYYLSTDNSKYWSFVKLISNIDSSAVVDLQNFFEIIGKCYQSTSITSALRQILIRSIITESNPQDFIKTFSIGVIEFFRKSNLPLKRIEGIKNHFQLPQSKDLKSAWDEIQKLAVIRNKKGGVVEDIQATRVNQNHESSTNRNSLKEPDESKEIDEITAKLKFSIEKNNTDNQKYIEFILGIDSIYINNAGLVILAPFLTAFFKKLNLVKDDKLINKNKAITLLNYLNTGNSTFDEFDIVLNKIVCGEAIEAFIEPTEITTEEKQEADDLLAAVIQHWSVLKNTSPDGLRGTFLKREGRLTFEDNKWSLKVQEQSFDMLLAHLPWGISVVKLPWMERVLYVEWI
jgi:hypothetical protein